MHVAVCIVSYNSAEDVEQCIAGLARSTYADFEVVICENAGERAAARLRSVVPDVLAGGQSVKIVVDEDNAGFAAGVNRCMAESAGADAWWVLNPDCLPGAGALRAMVSHQQATGALAVGGVIHHPDGWVQALGGGKWRSWLGRVEPAGYGQSLNAEAPQPGIAELDYLSGASFLVTAAFAQKVGKLREDYFLYGEEVEYFLRAKAQGIGLTFAQDANVAHIQGTSTGSAVPLRERKKLPIYLDQRNRVLVTRDTAPNRLFGVVVALFLQYPIIYGRRRAFRQWAYAVQGLWAGLHNERGKPRWLA